MLNSGGPDEDIGFDAFFKKATDHDPYPFQKRLALGELLPELIDLPRSVQIIHAGHDSSRLRITGILCPSALTTQKVVAPLKLMFRNRMPDFRLDLHG